ncbi:MAG: HAMP domain-containing sensor histidine kinase [Pseudohongiellaceae bacterium]
MIPLVYQVKRSLFSRLLLIFSVTVVVIFAIIWISLNQLNQINSNRIVAMPNFLVRNLESIIDEIGTPPNLEVASLLAQELDWTIGIKDPLMDWRSDNNFRLYVENSQYSRALSQDAEIRTINNEDVIVVNRDNYEYFMHQRSLQSTEYNYVGLYIGLALAAGVLFLNYLMVNNLLDPVRELKEGAERIQRGDLGFRVSTDRQDELGELTNSVNHMADSLQSMLEAKRQLLLAISHELRTPITRAKLQLEFMEDGSGKQNLNDDLNEIDLLISDLLEAERLNNKHSVLVAETVDISAFLASVTESYNDYAGGFKFTGLEQDEEVVLDRLRVRLLMTNLLNNAIRHGENKPIEVTLSYSIGVSTIEVVDHGEGIADHHLAKLTEPFYRADSARQRNTGGFGLGLYLCRLIAEAHGGSMRVSSQLGAGTIITVTLPKQPPDYKYVS